MEANEIIEMLSDNDIWQLLEDLNAQPKDIGSVIEADTVCHHGDSRKLTFYKDSRMFYCYTNCHSMSVFDFVMNSLSITFKEALKFITKKFNISQLQHYEDGFETQTIENPGEILNQKLKEEDFPSISFIDRSVLDSFYDLYHKSWINEGISTATMRKFNIKYDILNNRIIIPHFDKNNDLIGVRARNLNDEMVDTGKKYMPIYHDNKVLKHPTGANLFGLNKNIYNIEKVNTLILFESEKSVLQLDSFMPDLSIGLCISGSNLTNHQLNILKSLNVEEVIIGLDKEFEDVGSEEEVFYAQRIERIFYKKLSPFFKVSVLWDVDKQLDTQDSPTDKGKDVFKELYENRIFLK